jgi:hypothetical protein
MDSRVERRGPDRHLVALRLMRRIAIFALTLSLLLWVGPWALTEFGLLGPAPEEYVERAQRAINIARTYGAAPLPEFQKAEHERDRARDLVRAGRRRESRRAAESAMALATEAQKQALLRRSESQQRAEVVYNDLDRQINDLEKLYSSVTPGMEKQQVGQLLSLMKLTRQSAGAAFLAYEQQDWDGVLKAETPAREKIANTRKNLESARRP